MSFWLISLIALLPSLIWLIFYLRRDAHPEPNHMVIRVFSASVVATLLVSVLLYFLNSDFISLAWFISVWESISSRPAISFLVKIGGAIYVAAFFEELLKYFVVRETAVGEWFFDEPVDAMEYMVIAALGFAAVENVLVVTQFEKMTAVFQVTLARFLGATLIHTVASGVVGYFLARELFRGPEKRVKIRPINIFWGLALGSGLHAIYNWIIMSSNQLKREGYGYILLAFLVLSWAGVLYLFARLNKKSVA